MSTPKMSRRRFLKSTAYAAAGAGVVATAARAFADLGPGYALQGIDVSHWQGTVNWPAVRSSGRRFAFCKATEGIDFTDPRFASNWAGMRSVGMFRGAYHMGRPAVDAVAQADFFYNTVQPGPGDLPLVLDLEKTDSVAPAGVASWVQAFVSRLTTRMRRPPIIYVGFYFWQDSAGNGTNNWGCPLWMPVWEHDAEGKPKVVNPNNYVARAWSTFTFWQYSSRGSVAGLNPLDLDAFNGTTTQLNNLRLPL